MEQDYRLPVNIMPDNYKISISPKEDTFGGSVIISADVKQPVSEIILHGAQLLIHKVSLTGYQVTVYYDTKLEFIYLVLDRTLNTGPIILKLEYSGVINNSLMGLYKSGDKNRVLSTHFEGIYARHVYPCFDEPHFKATYDLTLVIERDLEAFSNMPLKSRHRVSSSHDEVIFERTPIMSTYLLAFVIGNYKKFTATNHPFSVVIPYNDKPVVKFALSTAIGSMMEYERVLGIDYTLPKLDLITVPELPAEAMENWGLITFKEQSLLQDITELSNKYEVASTISHELAHQFFGNLCTTFWWNSIWLNEGFAAYFEFVGIDAVAPEWEIWQMFFVKIQQDALGGDCFLATRPLDEPLPSNSSIEEIFDKVTYNKGAALVLMAADLMGRDNFYAGLHTYLTQCQYHNSTSSLLWRTLETPSLPLSQIMHEWTFEPGYPLVTIKEYPNGIKLKQSRYLPTSQKEDTVLWWIPTTIKCANGEKVSVTFNTRKSSLIAIDTESWYKVNYGQSSFLRVNYPIETWYRIIDNAVLDVVDWGGLLNDLLILSIDGILPLYIGLDLTYRILQKETRYQVWKSSADLLYCLADYFEGNDCLKYFNGYMVAVLNNVPNWIWTAATTYTESLAQPLLLSMCLYFKEPRVTAKANELFLKWRKSGIGIPDNLLEPILKHAVATMGDFGFEIIYRHYLKEHDFWYLRILTATKNDSFLKTLLSMGLDTDIVKMQDRIEFISLIGQNSLVAWEFVKDHWAELHVRGQSIQGLIENVTYKMYKYNDYEDVKNFFKAHQDIPPQITELALEKIQYNMIWRSRHIADSCTWLKQFNRSHPNKDPLSKFIGK